MAERSLASRVRRAVADAAAATRLVGAGNAAPAADLEPADSAPPPAEKPAREVKTPAQKRPTGKKVATTPKADVTTPTRTASAKTTTATTTTAKSSKSPATAKAAESTARKDPKATKPADPATASTKATPARKAATKAPAKTAEPAAAKTPGKRTPAKPAPAPQQPAPQLVEQPAPQPVAVPAGAAPTGGTALVVADHEDPWTPEEIDAIRSELTADLHRLQEEVAEADAGIADLLRDPSGMGGEDQADAGSKTFEREHEMALAASHRELLAQTERALLRISDGTFGVCESCGRAIGKARVQAFPRATLCLACKQREERR